MAGGREHFSFAEYGLCPPVVVLVAVTEDNLALIKELMAGQAVVLGGAHAGDPPMLPRGLAPDSAPARSVLDVGPLQVDLVEHAVRWDGRPIPVTEQEFGLLARLADPVGKAHSFDELGSQVWGTAEQFDATVVHSAVRRLRRKLAAAGADVAVESVRSYGFRLVEAPSGGDG